MIKKKLKKIKKKLKKILIIKLYNSIYIFFILMEV